MLVKKAALFLLFLIASCCGFADLSSVATAEGLTPTVESTPFLPKAADMPPSYEGAFVRMILTLIGLIVLIFATVWILKRLSRGNGFRFNTSGGKLIHMVEKRALSPKTMLYIIEVSGKRILISESQFDVRMLTGCQATDSSNTQKE